jgi:hypothetical protein
MNFIFMFEIRVFMVIIFFVHSGFIERNNIIDLNLSKFIYTIHFYICRIKI